MCLWLIVPKVVNSVVTTINDWNILLHVFKTKGNELVLICLDPSYNLHNLKKNKIYIEYSIQGIHFLLVYIYLFILTRWAAVWHGTAWKTKLRSHIFLYRVKFAHIIQIFSVHLQQQSATLVSITTFSLLLFVVALSKYSTRS